MKKFTLKTLCLIITAVAVIGLSVEQAGIAGIPDDGLVYASGDDVFLSFDGISDAGSVISQQDLGAYGVTKSELTLVAVNTDAGKGLKVALNRDSSRFCQSLTYTDYSKTAAAFKNAADHQYLRLWVYNPDAEEIGICVQLSAGSKTAMVNPQNARVTRCDGTALPLKTADGSGIGSSYHVMVPGGFAGWIAWPLTSSLEQAWSSPLLPSFEAATSFKLDIRPQAAGGSNYYILDDISLSAAAGGQTRNYTDPTTAGLNEKKLELDTMLNGYLSVDPKITEMPQYNPDSDPGSSANEWSNIRAITYDGAEINGKKTKVFAYAGFPKNASASAKVPAVVLVHGGGGFVYAEWIKQWTDRGYAAIAMSTTGYFPSPAGKGIAGRESDYYKNPAYWQYGLYGDFAETGYANAPNNDSMGSSGNAIDTQWMYHAVAQSILAHNILRNDSRVDSSRIGLTGISWGGIISSIAIGYDTRYAFAIPVYGSGYLDKGLTYMYDYFSPAATKALWSASANFRKVKSPVLWLGWSNDPSFSIQSNSLSYAATKGAGSVLSMRVDWSHGHSAGWSPAEIYRFADSAVKGGHPLTKCVSEPGTSRNISFQIRKPSDASSVTAKAWYLTEKMTYSMSGILSATFKMKTIDQTWASIGCTVSGNTVTGRLPADADNFYVEITTRTPGGTYITSTEYITVDPLNNGSSVSDASAVGNSSSFTSMVESNEGSSLDNGSSPDSGVSPDSQLSSDTSTVSDGHSESGNSPTMTGSTGSDDKQSTNSQTEKKDPDSVRRSVILAAVGALVLAAGAGFYFTFRKRKAALK